MRMKLGNILVLALVAVASSFLIISPRTANADVGTIEVVSSTVTSEFPQGIRFKVEITAETEITEVAVRFRIGQQTRGSYDYLTLERRGEIIDSELLFRTNSGSNFIPPGTLITYNFEIQDEEGNRLDTEPQEFIYHDPRFEWSEISEGPITVAYHGPVKRRAEAILEAAILTQETMGPLLGASIEEPIRLTVFNSVTEMLPALPPGSATIRRELVTEGQAFVRIGTVLVLGSGNRARGTTAHEVTHVLTHRAGDSVFRNVPQWLDEGLAEYGNFDPGFSYDIALQFALANDRLLPITSMPTLPGTPEDVIIFYGQSRSIVQFMVNEFGPDKMRDLMSTMRSGKNIDDSIEAVYGMTRIELENEWRDSLGAPSFNPPDLSAALPTPIPTPALELFTLDSVRGQGASTPEPEAVEEPTATPSPEPTATPSPVAVARADQPTASPEPPASSESAPQPGSSGGCNAPLYGETKAVEMSTFAVLIGLVGLAFRRRLRL